MRLLLNSMVLVSLFLVAGCKEPQTEINTISGELKLFLHQQEPIGLYVRFELKEDGGSAAQAVVASSGYKKIMEHPILFSLAFPVEAINQQSRYRFFASIAENQSGEKEISSMSLPVLTHGYPSTLHMAIQPVIEPVE